MPEPTEEISYRDDVLMLYCIREDYVMLDCNKKVTKSSIN